MHSTAEHFRLILVHKPTAAIIYLMLGALLQSVHVLAELAFECIEGVGRARSCGLGLVGGTCQQGALLRAVVCALSVEGKRPHGVVQPLRAWLLQVNA